MNSGQLAAALRTRWLGERGGVIALALAGGFIFWAVFQWRYASINPDFYQFRDDGIITLSHARNWVEFGFIGVNPSGERIEATSAPLQFLLYALAYALTHVGYEAFMAWQTLACTFAMGCLFALFFADRLLYALGASAAAALALTQMSAFMVWHGSGMENALTHVFLLWTVLLLHRFCTSGRVDMRWVVVPFLASITRIDALYHVAAVMMVFLAYWHWRRGDRQARVFALWLAGLWLLFNCCRFLYFGSLLPNTAVAQGISVGDRLIELVTLSPSYLDQSFGLARSISSRHGAYLLLLALPFVIFRHPPEKSALLLVMAMALVGSSFLTPFLFGPARLDTARTTTQMALFVMLAVAAAMHRWERRRGDLYFLAAVAIAAFLVHDYNRSSPTLACCSPKDFDGTRLTFVRLAREQGVTRPTVANPDLGVLSWHKQVNVVDLGLLGSAVVSRLPPGPALSSYILEHAAPDMIETHGWWTCRYASLLTDPRFAAAYVEAGPQGPQTIACNGFNAVPTGVWLRRAILRGAGTPERQLLDDLARAPSVERVAAEMRKCRESPGLDSRCAYVARSVYRVLPEFRAAGGQARLETVFRDSPSAAIDLYLIRGANDAKAYRAAVDKLSAR